MTHSSPRATPKGGSVRPATAADVDAVVAAVTTAFFDDPLWGPAFPDVQRRAEQASALWRLFVTSALRYPWTLVTAGVEAAAVWIPPGGTELDEQEQSGFRPWLVDVTDPAVAEGVLAIEELLEAARPREPHFYLSLLATHADHRGSGLGMGLLRDSLARVDALGAAAYLESSNPANDERYRRVGFVDHGEVTVPSGHVLTTMWRPAR